LGFHNNNWLASGVKGGSVPVGQLGGWASNRLAKLEW